MKNMNHTNTTNLNRQNKTVSKQYARVRVKKEKSLNPEK